MAAPDTEQPRPLLQAALHALETADAMSAVQFVSTATPLEAVGVCHALQRHFYWKKGDITLSSLIGRAGLQMGLIEADRLAPADPAAAAALRAAAKGLAYDLGSFNWPGWGDAPVRLGPNDVTAGFDAARTNLRLAVELSKPPLAMSRAWWLLGAHQLAAGQHAVAMDSFVRSAELGRCAGAAREELLAVGFAHLARLLQSPYEIELQQAYASHLRALAGTPDGDDSIAQLQDARRILPIGAHTSAK